MARKHETAEEFTAALPRLTNNPLPIQPPFVFNGMSSRVFPLRAHLGTLQRVVDGYMNFVPPQAGYFRVPMPYVFVMLLDYGQVAESVARIGWFAQTEVFFMVPLEWYKFVNGKWVFHDWAVITPYVFVNDEFSVPLGRTVFGFPKVLARVVATPDAWIKDATAPVTLARVDTSVFPETYSGTQIENRPLLEVERGTISNLQVPFVSSSPTMPWEIATNIARAAAGFGRDALWLAQSMRLSPTNPFSDPGAIQAMLTRMGPWFAPGGKGFIQNSINLKQFRRSEKPNEFCYQALTNGKMEVRAFNGAGLLGEYYTMLGDLSGGHTVRLYEYASLPLVSTLGLEVDRQWQGEGCTVNEMKPVIPYWLDVDILYDQGDNLAWRTSDCVWRDGTGAPFDPQPPTSQANAPDFNQTVTTAVDDIAGPFDFADTTVRVLPLLAKREKLKKFLDGYINKPLEGKLLDGEPLKGEPLRSGMLRKCSKDCKNPQAEGTENIRFTLWNRESNPENRELPEVEDLAYVYLMITSFGSITSTTNNVGDWTNYQLSFMIPVQFERKNEKGEWELVGVGLVPAFSFVDNCIAAIARGEVQGFEAVVANFVRPSSEWLSDTVALGDNPPQTLLSLESEVWPAIGTGQKAVIQPVIEVLQGDPCAGLGDAPDAPWSWSTTLRAELVAKKTTKADQSHDLKVARALALELLGNQTPFSAYSVKQFRDARDPSRACYQSLVRVPRQIKQLDDLREIEETLVVRIHDYPSLDIADQLGLLVQQSDEAGCGIISTTQAVRPFFLRGTLHEPLAERLAYRAGDDDWSIDPCVAFHTLLSEQEGAPKITVDMIAETLQDQLDPCRISDIVFQAAQRRRKDDKNGIKKETACQALKVVDPQTVIESILSREWGNADLSARWRVGREKLLTAYSARPVDGKTSAFTEAFLCAQINNTLANAPGAVAGSLSIDQAFITELFSLVFEKRKRDPSWKTLSARGKWARTMLEIISSQFEFRGWRMLMETSFSLLSSAKILTPALLDDTRKFAGSGPITRKELAALSEDLRKDLDRIRNLQIHGEPSESNNLDTHVYAAQMRLAELLDAFPKPPGKADDPKKADEVCTWALDNIDQFAQAVEQARTYCDAQYEALLNKLSRAYQKPDFCIRRDTVPDPNQLLPLSLSWDCDWYYGKDVAPKVAKTDEEQAGPEVHVAPNPQASEKRVRGSKKSSNEVKA
jgi:hypothetical protein